MIERPQWLMRNKNHPVRALDCRNGIIGLRNKYRDLSIDALDVTEYALDETANAKHRAAKEKRYRLAAEMRDKDRVIDNKSGSQTKIRVKLSGYDLGRIYLAKSDVVRQVVKHKGEYSREELANEMVKITDGSGNVEEVTRYAIDIYYLFY